MVKAFMENHKESIYTFIATFVAGMIRYAIGCLLIIAMKPWIAMIVYSVVLFPLHWWMYGKEHDEKIDKIAAAVLCVITEIIQFLAILFTYRWIGWWAVPVLAAVNYILTAITFDDEPRTKTSPPDEEAMTDEMDTMDGQTQEIPDDCDGPDPDGDLALDDGLSGQTPEEERERDRVAWRCCRNDTCSVCPYDPASELDNCCIVFELENKIENETDTEPDEEGILDLIRDSRKKQTV